MTKGFRELLKFSYCYLNRLQLAPVIVGAALTYFGNRGIISWRIIKRWKRKGVYRDAFIFVNGDVSVLGNTA